MPAAFTNACLLTPKQVAKRLNQHVDSVRRSIREGRIPAKKIAGRLYIHESVVTPPVSGDSTVEG